MESRLKRPPNKFSHYMFLFLRGGMGKCIGVLNTPNYHNYHNSASFREVKWSLMWFCVSIIDHLHGCVTPPCGSTTGPRSAYCSIRAAIRWRCGAFLRGAPASTPCLPLGIHRLQKKSHLCLRLLKNKQPLPLCNVFTSQINFPVDDGQKKTKIIFFFLQGFVD